MTDSRPRRVSGRRLPAIFALALTLLATAALSASAQTPGSLSGTVTDRNGAVVSRVEVTVKDPNGVSRTVRTNDDGRYQVPNLPAGSYDVTIVAAGFTSRTESGVEVSAGRNRVVDVTLEVAPSPEPPLAAIDSPLGVAFAGRSRFWLESGYAHRAIDGLFVERDIGTFINRLAGQDVGGQTIDNTAAARRDLTFKETTDDAFLGIRLLRPIGERRIVVDASGNLYIGEQEVSFTNPSGRLTTIAGNRREFAGDAFFFLAWRPTLGRRLFAGGGFSAWRSDFDGAARTPATTATGGAVTSEINSIKTTRFEFRGFGGVSAARLRTSFYAGLEGYRYDYNLGRGLSIDFSQTAPGATQQFTGETKLQKNGSRGFVVANTALGRRFDLSFEASFSPETFRARTGLALRFGSD